MSEPTSNLDIRTEQCDGACLITLTGEIDMHSAPGLRERLMGLSENPGGHFILDLTGVQYMDSSGVGTIVEFKRRTDRAGGSVMLVGLQPRVRSVFEITRLDKFFRIVDTLEQARQP